MKLTLAGAMFFIAALCFVVAALNLIKGPSFNLVYIGLAFWAAGFGCKELTPNA